MDYSVWAFSIAFFVMLPALLAVRMAKRRPGKSRLKVAALAALVAPVVLTAGLSAILLAISFSDGGFSALEKGIEDGGGLFAAILSMSYLIAPYALAFAVNWLVLKLMRLPRRAADLGEIFQ